MARPKNSRSTEELKQACRLIDLMGGISKTANYCGISPVSVWQWKINGIPKPWKMFFRSERPAEFGFLTIEKR